VVGMDSSCAFAHITLLGARSLAARAAFTIAVIALCGSVSVAGWAVLHIVFLFGSSGAGVVAEKMRTVTGFVVKVERKCSGQKVASR
jgi:bacteriorhodopsin